MTTYLLAAVRKMQRLFNSCRSRVIAVPARPLSFELLETRVLMSAKPFLDLPTSLPTALVADDRYEENDTLATGADLGLRYGTTLVSSLVSNDVDWYKFTTRAPGTTADYVQINFANIRGDLDMELYNSSGTLLGTSDGTTNLEKVSLYGLKAGTYYARVFGYNGALNPSYSLRVASAGSDDRYDQNDTQLTARNLGTLTKGQNFADLQAVDDDWYKFTTTRTGTNASFVQIGFNGSDADLDLRLYNAAGGLINVSNGFGNSEFISLDGLAKGTYLIKVNRASGPAINYDLSIAPPNASNGEHTLFVNFDGATLTRPDLNYWSGNGGNGLAAGQWFAGLSDPTNGLDEDNNGINITEMWSGYVDREQIIAGVLSNLNIDLAAFGIQAVRHFGDAVEDIEATTLFLGPSTLTNGGYHVACSIDVGNDNRTDIAFIGNDDVRGDLTTTAKRITALSDVALHEAGHTFGLYHVNSDTNTESMGLRYSQPSSRWLQNTSFQNRTYQLREFPDGNFQNSYQYMRNTFVLNVVSPAAPESLMTSDLIGGRWTEAQADGLLSISHVASASAANGLVQPWADTASGSLQEFAGWSLAAARNRQLN